MPILSIIPVLGFYSIACLCFGALALRLLTASDPIRCTAGAALASAFLLGQGLLANIWVLLGLSGWFKPLVVLTVLGLGTAGGAVLVWPYLAPFSHQLRAAGAELRRESLGWRLVALMAVAIYMAGFTSLGRPLMGDAAAFYMALPKVMADSYRLAPLPGYEAFTQIGLQGEMHYAALMTLGSADAAKLFAWPTILAGAVILAAAGSITGLKRRGQWIVFVGVFTSSSVLYLCGDGKVDLFATALGLAAYFWAVQMNRSKGASSVRFAGLFVGFAVVAKFSYLPVLLPGIVCLSLWSFLVDQTDKSEVKANRLRAAALFLRLGFWISLAVIPHLIKNYILFDNPLAPFSASGAGWAGQRWFSADTTRHILLTYPMSLTIGQYWGQYGNLSPLVLAFAPITLLLSRPKPFLGSPLVALTLAAGSGLVCWVILHPSLISPRYILSTLLILILPAARAAEHVSLPETGMRWLSGSVLGSILVTQVFVAFYFSDQVFFPKQTKRYLMGRLSECERDGTYCRGLNELGDRAEPGARVLLAAYYGYWMRPDLLQCTSTEEELKELREKKAELFWLSLCQRGFEYVVIDKTTHGSLMKNLEKENIPSWVKISPQWGEGNLLIFHLEFENPPCAPVIECRQENPPAWILVDRKIH